MNSGLRSNHQQAAGGLNERGTSRGPGVDREAPPGSGPLPGVNENQI